MGMHTGLPDPYFPSKEVKDKIEDKYIYNSTNLTKYTNSMYDHYPILRSYAEKCDHVTEFGTQFGEGSLIAFMAAKPKKIVVYDSCPQYSFFLNQKMGIQSGLTVEFFKKDTTKLEKIEETDMLFIDAMHTYTAVKEELRQAKYVKKWILFHDTWQHKFYGDQPNSFGVWLAVTEFLALNRDGWKLIKIYDNCSGLTIIERVK